MEQEAIHLDEFKYDLPEDRIAKYPLDDRSASKLLIYKNGVIDHRIFNEADQFLNDEITLFFNNTKVIPARIVFQKSSGAFIELFLLQPLKPTEVASAMEVKNYCRWKCLIGNKKRWRSGEQYIRVDGQDVVVSWHDRDNDEVDFKWDSGPSFAELIELCGKIPLPPYLNRQNEPSDAERYQTIYSKAKGAVAAPTAGLHFDNELIDRMLAKGVTTDYLTLHVSAGTFQPIKVQNVTEHPMHNEQIVVTRANIESLINAEKVYAVGTTSMRTLESLYWFGVKLMKGDPHFHIEKLYPYQTPTELDRYFVWQQIANWMDRTGRKTLIGNTEIFIMPGYRFRVCEGLFTNYHLPGSTLLLLVAAFIGKDWKRVYREALDNQYRFLSYGDGSLLIP